MRPTQPDRPSMKSMLESARLEIKRQLGIKHLPFRLTPDGGFVEFTIDGQTIEVLASLRHYEDYRDARSPVARKSASNDAAEYYAKKIKEGLDAAN